MLGNINQIDTLRSVQGDLVLVHDGPVDRVLTIVRVMGEHQTLRLVNKAARVADPDWEIDQVVADAIVPAPTNKVGAKWELTVP
jgi:hypothetical protein